MKKVILFAIVGAMAVVGCGQKEFNLSTDTPNLLLSDGESTSEVLVHGSDGNCQIDFAPDWLEVTVQDSTLIVNAKPNTTNAKREDQIVVRCGKSTLPIVVSQYQKATKLDLPNGKSISISKDGGSQELAVVSDGLVTVESIDSVSAIWSNGLLKVSAPENKGHRIKGFVRLSAGELVDSVEVVVDGIVCATCKGTGKVRCKSCGGQGHNFNMSVQGIFGCKACGGRGASYRGWDENFRNGSGKQTCPTCNGKG